jgi:hypothetical protein
MPDLSTFEQCNKLADLLMKKSNMDKPNENQIRVMDMMRLISISVPSENLIFCVKKLLEQSCFFSI